MNATLMSLGGRELLTVRVESTWSRGDILLAVGMLAASEYRLFYGQLELTDDLSLAGIGFQSGATLLLLIRARAPALLVAGCLPLIDVEEWSVDLSSRQLLINDFMDVVNAAAFSPDGEWIVTACEDGTLSRWHRETGARRALYSASDAITALAYHPRGVSVAFVIGEREVRAVDAESGALYFREKDGARRPPALP